MSENISERIMDKYILPFLHNHSTLFFVLLFIFILFWLLNILANSIPKLDLIRLKLLKPLAEYFSFKKLKKKAIKNDIVSHMNLELKKMRKMLPEEWIKNIVLEWVRNEDQTSFLQDNKVVIRLRPLENQDSNFINASYNYLSLSLFPRSSSALPDSHVEACKLHICRKLAKSRNNTTLHLFEDDYLEPVVSKNNKILSNIRKYEILERKGFFNAVFLREIHSIAYSNKLTEYRKEIPNEVERILKHIMNFIKSYESNSMQVNTWFNSSILSKYGILLVARPCNAESNNMKIYINQVNNFLSLGVNRIYVLGTSKEKVFADSVLNSIENNVKDVLLVNKFENIVDYRGENGGICGIFDYQF